MSRYQPQQTLSMTPRLYLVDGCFQGLDPSTTFPPPGHGRVRLSATTSPSEIPTFLPPSQVLIGHPSVPLFAAVFDRAHYPSLRQWSPPAETFSSPLPTSSRPRSRRYLMQRAETFKGYQSVIQILNRVASTYIPEAFSIIVFIISFPRASVIRSASRTIILGFLYLCHHYL